MSTQLEHKFEIIVGEAGGEIHNADIPVRWCAHPNLIKEMTERGIKDPHILLVSYKPDFGEMQRQLVPLNELMTYLRFTRAGEAKVYAWIMNGELGRKKIHDDFLRMHRGHYKTDLFGWNDEIIRDLGISVAFTEMSVDIPKGVFGKEPPPLLKWYANWMHSDQKVVDECQFRRRLLLSIPKIPVFIAATIGFLLIRLFAAFIVVGFGFRKYIDWKNLAMCWRYPSLTPFVFDDDKLWVKNNSLYWKTIPGPNTKSLLAMALAPIVPFASTIFGVAIALIGDNFYAVDGAWMSLSIYFTILAFGAVVDLVMIVVYFLAKILEKNERGARFAKAISKRVTAILERIIERDWMELIDKSSKVLAVISTVGTIWLFFTQAYLFMFFAVFMAIIAVTYVLLRWLDDKSLKDNDPLGYMDLLCPEDETNLMAKYEMIPKKNRTLRLKYLDFKNHVCKPMQY